MAYLVAATLREGGRMLRGCLTGAIVATGAIVSACGSDTSPPAPGPSASSAPEAPPSPFSVVLRSPRPVTFSELSGGVVAADSGKGRLARAPADGELSDGAMPGGLPDATGSILRLAGRPESLWLTYEIPGEGEGKDKKQAKHPLLRLDSKKGEWKQFADDWRPLLGVWSKNRILAASTSSGKLKIKVMEPYSKKAPPDLPNPKVDDAECDKTLRVEALSPLASGAVWMAGTCKPAGATARKHVAVLWAPVDEAALAAASASAKASSAPSAAPSATATAEAAPSGVPSADAAGEAPAEEPKGPPGKVIVAPAGAAHRGWAVLSEKEIWLLGDGEKGAGATLHHFTGDKLEPVPLPALDGAARAISVAADGVLWLASERSVYKQEAGKEWQSVPLPNGPLGVASAPWEVFAVAAAGKDVWASAKATLPSGAAHVILRLRPSKEALTWQ